MVSETSNLDVSKRSEAANVLDVAQYAFDKLKNKHDSTYMKLQKIVYYSEVQSLMHYGESLFKEKILAYCAGPVVEELFWKHRGYRYFDKKVSIDGRVSNLSSKQKTCVDWALEKYGKCSGDLLSNLTHAEDPWKEARKDYKPDDTSCREEITRKSMIDYYSKHWREDPEDYEEVN